MTNQIHNHRISTCVLVFKIIIVSLIVIAIILVLVAKNIKTAPNQAINSQPIDIISVNETNLIKNFFKTSVDSNHDWLSVGSFGGAYNKQYYCRDTFITFIGGVEATDRIKSTLVHAIDWFGENMENDGYIPLWFQETDVLNKYLYCPYFLTQETGGIRQLDHQLEFMDGIFMYYKKTNDINWLKDKKIYLERSFIYLNSKVDNYLLVGDYSENAGNDWKDAVMINGKSTFVNAYWYKVNLNMAEIEKVLGNDEKARYYLEFADNIKGEFNKEFWTESVATNCDLGKFGHYISWKNTRNIDGRSVSNTYDYFDLDGNSLAVALGIPNKENSQKIMNIIEKNFDYFVNKYGAVRTVCGYYNEDATKIKKDDYQNGGYWYTPSYYLTMALVKINNRSRIGDMYDRVGVATIASGEKGLAEWYYEDGNVGGATNYSWSLAYPLFLSSIINNTNQTWRLGQ